MSDHYSTTDPFVMAWMRHQGVKIAEVVREGTRSRMYFECTEPEGLDHELRYRDSEFERFQMLFTSTMDILKRR